MKKCTAFIIFAFICLSCFAQEEKLSYEYLYESKWAPKEGSWGYWLEFSKEKTYRIYFNGEGGGQEINGVYSISNDGVELNITSITSKEYLPKELIASRSVWILQKDEESILFTDKLILGDKYSFWRVKSKVPENEIRHVNGIKLIISEKKKCELIYNARVRKGPSVTYEYYYFEIEGSGKMPFLPKKWDVEIIGHSENIETIDGNADYWYYCETDMGWYDSGPIYGWIFGSLIRK